METFGFLIARVVAVAVANAGTVTTFFVFVIAPLVALAHVRTPAPARALNAAFAVAAIASGQRRCTLPHGNTIIPSSVSD